MLFLLIGFAFCDAQTVFVKNVQVNKLADAIEINFGFTGDPSSNYDVDLELVLSEPGKLSQNIRPNASELAGDHLSTRPGDYKVIIWRIPSDKTGLVQNAYIRAKLNPKKALSAPNSSSILLSNSTATIDSSNEQKESKNDAPVGNWSSQVINSRSDQVDKPTQSSPSSNRSEFIDKQDEKQDQKQDQSQQISDVNLNKKDGKILVPINKVIVEEKTAEPIVKNKDESKLLIQKKAEEKVDQVKISNPEKVIPEKILPEKKAVPAKATNQKKDVQLTVQNQPEEVQKTTKKSEESKARIKAFSKKNKNSKTKKTKESKELSVKSNNVSIVHKVEIIELETVPADVVIYEAKPWIEPQKQEKKYFENYKLPTFEEVQAMIQHSKKSNDPQQEEDPSDLPTEKQELIGKYAPLFKLINALNK